MLAVPTAGRRLAGENEGHCQRAVESAAAGSFCSGRRRGRTGADGADGPALARRGGTRLCKPLRIRQRSSPTILMPPSRPAGTWNTCRASSGGRRSAACGIESGRPWWRIWPVTQRPRPVGPGGRAQPAGETEGEETMRDNPIKHRLSAGGSAFGTMVFEFFTPGMAQIAAAAGAGVRALRHGAQWRRHRHDQGADGGLSGPGHRADGPRPDHAIPLHRPLPGCRRHGHHGAHGGIRCAGKGYRFVHALSAAWRPRRRLRHGA